MNYYTSIKVPIILSQRFNKTNTDPRTWEGYRTFSEFAIEKIRDGVQEFEKKVESRPFNGSVMSK